MFRRDPGTDRGGRAAEPFPARWAAPAGGRGRRPRGGVEGAVRRGPSAGSAVLVVTGAYHRRRAVLSSQARPGTPYAAATRRARILGGVRGHDASAQVAR